MTSAEFNLRTRNYLNGHRRALQSLRSSLDFSRINQASGDVDDFDFSSAPFPVFGAAGAGPITVLSWTVPPGTIAVIKWMAVVYVGAGFQDGSGNVIWRVLKNGAALRGLNNLQSQIGSWALPNEFLFYGIEGDIFLVTAEVPAGAVNPPGPNDTTGARMRGYFFPIAGGSRQ